MPVPVSNVFSLKITGTGTLTQYISLPVPVVRDGFINLVRPFLTGYSLRRTFHGFAPSVVDISCI